MSDNSALPLSLYPLSLSLSLSLSPPLRCCSDQTPPEKNKPPPHTHALTCSGEGCCSFISPLSYTETHTPSNYKHPLLPLQLTEDSEEDTAGRNVTEELLLKTSALEDSSLICSWWLTPALQQVSFMLIPHLIHGAVWYVAVATTYCYLFVMASVGSQLRSSVSGVCSAWIHAEYPHCITRGQQS